MSPDPMNDPESMNLVTLTDAVFLTGISANCLRRYEADLLIRPIRTARGLRLYSPKDLTLARMIYQSRMKRHGRTGPRRATAES
jgi:DNA-binding transcriptional MerR regulator